MSLTPLKRALSSIVPSRGVSRHLGLATLVDRSGTGLFLSAGVVFLTRHVGLPAGQVGAGLACGGAAGVVAGVAIGDMADRFGAREVYVATLLLEAVAAVGLLLVDSFAVFLVAAVVAKVSEQGSRSAAGALMAITGGPDGRVALRAQVRALANLGVSIGALLGGVALALDTTTAYDTVILADAATFAIAAALVMRMPRHPAPPARPRGAPRWVAVRDRGYLAVTAVNAMLSLNYAMLTVGLPLWVTTRTDAPRWSVAVLLLINTIGVMVLQVPVSRGVATLWAAGRAQRRAGWAFAVAWTLLGLAHGLAPLPALAPLVVGTAVHTVGELLQAAGSFELSFGLARSEAQGQYQGVFGIGSSAANAVAPMLAASVCVAFGLVGWIAVGALVAAVGALAPTIVRRATVHREATLGAPVVAACEGAVG